MNLWTNENITLIKVCNKLTIIVVPDSKMMCPKLKQINSKVSRFLLQLAALQLFKILLWFIWTYGHEILSLDCVLRKLNLVHLPKTTSLRSVLILSFHFNSGPQINKLTVFILCSSVQHFCMFPLLQMFVLQAPSIFNLIECTDSQWIPCLQTCTSGTLNLKMTSSFIHYEHTFLQSVVCYFYDDGDNCAAWNVARRRPGHNNATTLP
jgi:hypothetical protein